MNRLIVYIKTHDRGELADMPELKQSDWDLVFRRKPMEPWICQCLSDNTQFTVTPDSVRLFPRVM